MGEEIIHEVLDAPGRVLRLQKRWAPELATPAVPDAPFNSRPIRFGKVVGATLRPEHMTNAAGVPLRILETDGFLIEVGKRTEQVPLWHRNVRSEELVFAHRGEALCEAELGVVETGPGWAHIRPLGCGHRAVPKSEEGTFNVIFESALPFTLSPIAAAAWEPARQDVRLPLEAPSYSDWLDGPDYCGQVDRSVRPSDVIGVQVIEGAPHLPLGRVHVVALARSGTPQGWDGAVPLVTTAAGLTLGMARAATAPTVWHRNLRCDEVVFLHQGTLTLHTELGVSTLQPGDFAILPRGISHLPRPSGDALWLVLEYPALLRWAPAAQASFMPATPSLADFPAPVR